MWRERRVLPALAIAAAGSIAFATPTSPLPQTRHFQANGAQLEYVDEGKGTPIVFAHGAVTDLRYWEPQREAIARRHRFIAFTYRYHGTAPWSDDAKLYSADTHAADLAALIAGLKAGPVHLVGLSYGGSVAALLATKEPALLRTLTLAEPALFGLAGGTPEGKAALDAWGKSMAPIGAAMQAGDAITATKHLAAVVNGEPLENFDKLPPALRQSLLDNARTLPRLFAAPPPAISCESLRTVKVPTLVVRGERTPEIFARTNEAVAGCIPGSRLAVIPQAAHTMSYQNPEAFNAALLQFVEQK